MVVKSKSGKVACLPGTSYVRMLSCGIGDRASAVSRLEIAENRVRPRGRRLAADSATWAQLKPQYCISAAMILHNDDLRFDWVHILVSSNEMTE